MVVLKPVLVSPVVWNYHFKSNFQITEGYDLTNANNRQASLSKFVRKIKNEANFNLAQLCCQQTDGNNFWKQDFKNWLQF